MTSSPFPQSNGLRDHSSRYNNDHPSVSVFCVVMTLVANGAVCGLIIFVSVRFAYNAVTNQLYVL